MKLRLILALQLTVPCVTPECAEGQAISVLALRHATVVDVVTERLLTEQTVVVRGGIITSVGPDSSTRVPSGAQVVDCTGKFLLPGLWDMHVHVPEFSLPNDPKNAERLGLRYTSALLIANGVTGARVGSGNLKRLSEFRAEIRRGDAVGPRLVLTGQKVGEQPAVPGAPFPISSELDARLTVRLLKDRGADFVKVSSALPAPFWRATADEARKQKLPLVGHLPTTVTLVEASDLGMASVEHLFNLPRETSENDGLPNDQGLTTVLSRKTGQVLNWLRIVGPPAQPVDVAIASHDTAKSREKFSHLKARGTWVTPTLVLTSSMLQEQDRVAAYDRRRFLTRGMDSVRYVERRTVSPRMYSAQLLAFHMALVRELRDAGVSLLAGSDAPTLNVLGFALHDELQLLVRAGLTPAEALRAATSDVGRFLRADSVGVIRRGAAADLVLLDEDPLRDISATRRIRGVVAAGRFHSRIALDQMLDSAAAIARLVPEQKRSDRIAEGRESGQRQSRGTSR